MADTALGLALGYVSKTLENQGLMQQNIERGRVIQAEQQNRVLTQHAMQLDSMGAPQVQKTGAGMPDMFSNQMDAAQSLMSAGRRQMLVNPKMAGDMMMQAASIQHSAMQTQNEQLKNKETALKQLSGWVNQVDSQESLAQIHDQVEVLHPGMWAANKLPTEYSDQTAPVFKHLAAATSTALQQVQLQSKEIDLQNRAEYDKARLEKIQAETRARDAKAARDRDALEHPKSAQTAYDKYQSELTKAEEVRASNIAKAQQTAGFRKLSEKTPSKGWFDSADTPAPLSARSKELARITQVEQYAYQAKKDAIDAKAARAGIVTAQKDKTSGTPNISSVEEYNALPSGTKYTDPNGVTRTKK